MALVVDRHLRQAIVIETTAGPVRVWVGGFSIDGHQYRRGRVKLVIDAPDEVRVLREELRPRPEEMV